MCPILQFTLILSDLCDGIRGKLDRSGVSVSFVVLESRADDAVDTDADIVVCDEHESSLPTAISVVEGCNNLVRFDVA